MTHPAAPTKVAPKTWVLATRPWSFPASAMPGLIALSFAAVQSLHRPDLHVDWLLGLLGVVGAVIFQASGNVISDYHDFRRGVDRPGTYGGSKLLVDGIVRPRQALAFGLCLLAAGSILGLTLTALTGPWLLLLGALGVAAALFYSQFKFAALGDIMIFLTFGLLIPLGVTYCATGRLDWPALLPAATVGLLIVAILHANNTRDIVFDREAGIKTQAMLFGVRPSIWYYAVLTLGAYVGLLLLATFHIVLPLALVALLSLPLAIRNARTMRMAKLDNLGAIKNSDVLSAQLVLVFSALFVLGNLASLVLR